MNGFKWLEMFKIQDGISIIDDHIKKIEDISSSAKVESISLLRGPDCWYVQSITWNKSDYFRRRYVDVIYWSVDMIQGLDI